MLTARTDFGAPHVQVNRGQPFHIEWMGGHPGSYHYFTVMAAKDEYLMAQNTEEVLNQYLAEAPVEARIEGVAHHKYHFGWTGSTPGATSSHSVYASEGKVALSPSDANYIELSLIHI